MHANILYKHILLKVILFLISVIVCIQLDSMVKCRISNITKYNTLCLIRFNTISNNNSYVVLDWRWVRVEGVYNSLCVHYFFNSNFNFNSFKCMISFNIAIIS